ncbi:7364_t:CDS:2 [Cetraspora pellucida]|uniref:7364_t:CDS:1 n=1 Tax=Cetraspora pellucida TaxID=1433469 RepID=A0A9N9EAK2_9GLOM|nr:7364_t:CDS:2 [Cetraspora pellucida]
MTITSSTTTTSRTKNNSDTDTEKPVTCNRKTRTYSRTQRIKVTTVGKAISTSSRKNSTQEKQRYGNCSKCKESDVNMKILGEHVERLEQLVNDLAKTAKCDDRSSTYSGQKLRCLPDLSNCSLEDLQKLMINTTNIMFPQKSSKVVDKSSNEQVCKTVPIPVLKANFHAEPMEDVSYISNDKSPISKLNAFRQDSGFSESKAGIDHC